MNYFDIVVASIVLILGLKGLISGFFKELFGLIGIVGGVFVASHIGVSIGEFINGIIFNFESNSAINLLGFIIALGIFWMLMVLLGIGFKKLTAISGLGVFDRVLGFILSGGKFYFILSMIIYGLFSVEALRESFIDKFDDSLLFEAMYATGDFLVDIKSDDITQHLGFDSNDSNTTKEDI